MSRTINDDEARKLEFDILKKFAEFCEKKNLRYFLAYGTLIGAIRHKGFIPWDNDVDVVMPRPDYEQLIQYLKKEKIQGSIDCLDYHEIKTFPFVKLSDNRTRLKENYLITEENMGIYIDIFPLDGFPDSQRKQRWLFQKAKIYYKLFALANYRPNTGANKVKKFLKWILYPVSRCVSSKWVCDKLNDLCKNYAYDQSNMVGNIVWGFGTEEIVSRNMLGRGKAEFEGTEFCIPSGYDLYLRQCYGNYMELPPVEQRIVHEFEAEWK